MLFLACASVVALSIRRALRGRAAWWEMAVPISILAPFAGLVAVLVVGKV